MAKTYVYFETNSSEKLEPVKFKKKVENLPSLEKAGYKFIGWFDERLEKEFDINQIYKEDVKLFAKWEPLTIDELLNDLEHFSKTTNVLRELQNDYGDIPEIKESKTDINKKQPTKKAKSTAKKKPVAKKSTAKKVAKPKKDVKNEVDVETAPVEEVTK